jgi:hypothetical protein
MTDVQIDPELEVEPEPETDGEPDAPVELPGPDVDGPADDDGAEDDDADANQPETETETEDGDEQARQQAALNEADLEKLHGKLTKANEAHARKVATIMGEDAEALIPCPVCSEFVAGAIFPPEVAPLPEHVKENMKQLLGYDTWEAVPAVSWAQECPECHGYGNVKTGSKVAGAETTGCLNCNTRGWLNTRTAMAALGALEHPEGEIVTGPTVFGTEPDERVAALQAEGFTVIAPMHFAQAS